MAALGHVSWGRGRSGFGKRMGSRRTAFSSDAGCYVGAVANARRISGFKRNGSILPAAGRPELDLDAVNIRQVSVSPTKRLNIYFPPLDAFGGTSAAGPAIPSSGKPSLGKSIKDTPKRILVEGVGSTPRNC